MSGTTDALPELAEADFYLPVTLEAREEDRGQREVEAGDKPPLRLQNLPCKIYLPRKHEGQVRVSLSLPLEEAKDWWGLGGCFWRSALYGELPYDDRSRVYSEGQSADEAAMEAFPSAREKTSRPPFWRGLLVRAKTVYITKGPEIRGNIAFQEITLMLEPMDIEIEEVLWPGAKSKQFVPGHFWLTGNKFLDGLSTRPKHDIYIYAGSGRKPFGFPLSLPAEGFQDEIKDKVTRLSPIISLEQQINSYQNVEGDTVIVREQIMPFRLTKRDRERFGVDQRLVHAVDNWVLLASFGSRWPTTCLGWELFDAHSYTRHFRCGRTRPRTDELRWEEQDSHYGLVDFKNFEEFLSHSYNFLHRSSAEDREVLQQVLERILTGYGRFVESSFLALYAALEMLVLRFRKTQGLELIFTPEEWKIFESDATRFVKSHPLTASNKKRRKLLYEKGPELNRISFGTAFEEFCASRDHPVPLGDLWPVTGKNSLSILRNELVHGETFSAMRHSVLGTATSHLQWWLERMVLSLIGWPIERSMVAPRFLKEITDYTDWQQEQRVLFMDS